MVAAPHPEADKPAGRHGLKKLLKVRCSHCDNNVGNVQTLGKDTYWFLKTKVDGEQQGVAVARTELRGTTAATPFQKCSGDPWSMEVLATALDGA